MTVDGVADATEADLAGLRDKLRDREVYITNLPRSPMNLLLVELVNERVAHRTSDPALIRRFTPLNDAELEYDGRRTEIIGETGAIVVWAGGKVSQNYVTRFRRKYVEVDKELRTNHAKTEELAGLVADGVPSRVPHQVLDQEVIHPEAMVEVQRVLAEFVEDRITFCVPPDDALVHLPDEVPLPDGARPYQFSTAPKSITVPVPRPTPKYLIVITIGHGSDDGQTFFPPVGTVTAQVLADGLGPAPDAALCVPLQCFPMQSVNAWQGVAGWSAKITSASIPHLNESNDAEMLAWIRAHLADEIAKWFDGLV
ncbi:hypothetical protein AB0I91_40800 [Actinosynnema sp. NPDC049800]